MSAGVILGICSTYTLLTILITHCFCYTSADGTNNGGIHLFFSVREELPAERFVGDIARSSNLDKKYTPNVLNSIFYVFLRKSTDSDLFILEEQTGVLRTRYPLDRDALCPKQWTCTIKLNIAVQPALYFEVIKVDIFIVDINDNNPVFPNPRIRLAIPENALAGAEYYPLPGASDLDSPPNGVVDYRFSNFISAAARDCFRLDVKNNSGGFLETRLILLRELDREEIPDYELIVIADDGGDPRRSASLVVDVDVGDVNDNSPMFERGIYQVEIRENMPIGTTVVRMTARDADTGQNGHVRYRFSDRSSATYGHLFVMDPETGDVVLLQPLNHAVQGSYSLSVLAEDQGDYSKPAHSALLINVTDVNDHAPIITVDAMFDTGGSPIEVAENADVGSFVAHVSTSDADGGDNGKVDCSIDSQDFRLVQIFEGEYKIVTATKLDREKVAHHSIMINCQDLGKPRLSTNKHVQISIGDVNDHEPRFTHALYNASLPENSPWGSFVVRVSASDPDRGFNGEMAYMLDQAASSLFHIDPDTGVITTLTELDHEKTPTIQLQVIAANKGEHNRLSKAFVSLIVTDIDDEKPSFQGRNFSYNVPENEPANTEVGQIWAVDNDSPPYNSFSYYLGSHNDIFRIDPGTGMIYTKVPLDREKRSSYVLDVRVQSNTVSISVDTAMVNVYVTDINDNRPVLHFPNENNSTAYVFGYGSLNIPFAKINAYDADLGLNAAVSYVLSGGNDLGLFALERNTGRLKPIADLGAFINQSFVLTVRVTDHGSPSYHTTGDMLVVVLDGTYTENELAAVGPVVQNKTSSIADWFGGNLLVFIAACLGVCIIVAALLAAAACLVRRRNKRKLDRLRSMTRVELTEMTTAARNEDEAVGEESKLLMRMAEVMLVNPEAVKYGGTLQRTGQAPTSQGKICRTTGVPAGPGSLGGVPSAKGGAIPSYPGGGRGKCEIHGAAGDTDSGCADVSNSNDDFSNGSDQSRDLEPGLLVAGPHLSRCSCGSQPTSSITSPKFCGSIAPPRTFSNPAQSLIRPGLSPLPNQSSPRGGGLLMKPSMEGQHAQAELDRLTAAAADAVARLEASMSNSPSHSPYCSTTLPGSRKSVRFAVEGGRDPTRIPFETEDDRNYNRLKQLNASPADPNSNASNPDDIENLSYINSLQRPKCKTYREPNLTVDDETKKRMYFSDREKNPGNGMFLRYGANGLDPELERNLRTGNGTPTNFPPNTDVGSKPVHSQSYPSRTPLKSFMPDDGSTVI